MGYLEINVKCLNSIFKEFVPGSLWKDLYSFTDKSHSPRYMYIIIFYFLMADFYWKNRWEIRFLEHWHSILKATADM